MWWQLLAVDAYITFVCVNTVSINRALGELKVQQRSQTAEDGSNGRVTWQDYVDFLYHSATSTV